MNIIIFSMFIVLTAQKQVLFDEYELTETEEEVDEEELDQNEIITDKSVSISLFCVIIILLLL